MMLPEYGSTNRLMQRMRVDFPAPLGPITAQKSFAATLKSMPRNISGPELV
jgi:hypothetical protein